MGEVWRGEHLGLGTPVAVKLLNPAVLDSKVAAARFKREAQAAASLRGNNVVQLLDYGVEDDSPYIVMELLEGESLASRLSRMAPLSARDTAHLLGQVGKAVAKAHGLSIVHRDLKPDNVFIVRDGDEEVAKVLDFGIAKTLSNESLQLSIQTTSGAILGTPHYMSPEQASGRAKVDHRSDIWSFGVIAFECLTGYRPFNGSTLGGLVVAICTDPIPTPSNVGPVPRRFDDWFFRCVARDAAQRFQTMMEAVTALRLICDPPAHSSASMPPLLDGDAREPTLQASLRSSSLEAQQPSSGEEASETVSASARTLGTIRRRRSTGTYYVLAAAALVCVVAGGLRLRAAFGPSDPRALETSAAASSTALLLASTASATPVASSSPPAQSAAVTESPAVLVAPIGQSAVPQRTAPKIKSPPTPRNRAAINAQDVPTRDTGTPKAVSPPEPVTRPPANPSEPDSASRRRNIEDRLAF